MQADQKNQGKPQLSYLFTFEDGITLAFEDSDFREPLEQIGRWYRQAHDKLSMDVLKTGVLELLDTLSPDWPEFLCHVSEAGAAKYPRGNYLHGMPWSWILDSLLRHCRAVDRGDNIDPELGLPHAGAIAWRAVYLLHCVTHFPEQDDRVRPPVEPADVEPRADAFGDCAPFEPDTMIGFKRPSQPPPVAPAAVPGSSLGFGEIDLEGEPVAITPRRVD